MKVSWLNLHEKVSQRDVRKLIYKKLTAHDRFVVEIAHGKEVVQPSLDFLCHAAQHGYMALLKWASTNESKWHTKASAALCGNSPALEWLQSQDCLWDLRFAIIKGCEWNHVIIYFAAERGHLEIVQWMNTRYGVPLDYLVCAAASRRGRLHVLKWIRDNGCISDDIDMQAAYEGHLDIVKWLHSIGNPCRNVCLKAAWGGHLHILQWARAQGIPWDHSTCTVAAACGHLHILQWVRSIGCPWSIDTCENAIAYGRLEALKWLIENGCPYVFERLVSVAVSDNILHVVDWLRTNSHWLNTE